MSWSGNNKVGSGSQEITQSVQNRKVASDLISAVRPRPRPRSTLTTEEAGTQVVWSLDIDLGNNPIGALHGH